VSLSKSVASITAGTTDVYIVEDLSHRTARGWPLCLHSKLYQQAPPRREKILCAGGDQVAPPAGELVDGPVPPGNSTAEEITCGQVHATGVQFDDDGDCGVPNCKSPDFSVKCVASASV
jgi:hypothetical protein